MFLKLQKKKTQKCGMNDIKNTRVFHVQWLWDEGDKVVDAHNITLHLISLDEIMNNMTNNTQI